MEECQILTTQEEVHTLAAEWNALGTRSATYYFSDFESADTWMRTVGHLENTHYHIITCRREGRLTGLLPLVVTKKHGLRLLRWVGHDVFFGPIQLYETEADREALWRAAITSSHYDCAKIKYIFADTPEERLIATLPTALQVGSDEMALTTFGPEGGTGWYNNLSSHARRDHQYKLRGLAKTGTITVCGTHHGPFSHDHITQMIKHKEEWTQRHNKQSGIFHSNQFMLDLVRQAEASDTLVLMEIKRNNEPIAMTISFALGETLCAYMLTYNPRWLKHSVGTIAMLETLRWAGDNGFKCANLLEGANPYKKRYTNKREGFATYLWANTWRGRFALALYALVRLFKKPL